MRIAKDNGKRIGLLISFMLLVMLAVSAASAAAAVGPKWRLDSLSNSSVAPGGVLKYTVQATNVGDESTPVEPGPDGEPETGDEVPVPSLITATLPVGMKVKTASLFSLASLETFECFDVSDGASPAEGAQGVVCENPTSIPWAAAFAASSFGTLTLEAEVDPSASGTLTASFEVSGGGAEPVGTVDPVTVAPGAPSFGLHAFDGLIAADAAGTPLAQAGAHPHGMSVSLDFNTLTNGAPLTGDVWPVEATKDILTELPPGLVGNPTIADTCTLEELANADVGFAVKSLCPPTSQLGTTQVRLKGVPTAGYVVGPLPVFNMPPPPGVAARFGFSLLGSIIVLDAQLRDDDYGVSVNVRNISQALAVAGTTIDFWGVPASKEHGEDAPDYVGRRACPGVTPPNDGGPSCLSGSPQRPFLRMPTACGEAGVAVSARVDSWENPGVFEEATWRNHQAPRYPAPPSDWGPEVGVSGCENVPVRGKLEARPTALDAETSTGLNVHVEVPNPGFDNPTGIASSDLKAVKVSLPQGLTINPSQAEGLGVCSPAQYASTELSFHPDGQHGCPSDSKIGTVNVKTPLLEEDIPGDVYIAAPYDNPFGSLLALYIVLHNEQRGILIKLAGRVETDGKSGKIVTTFDDLPQLPFDSFDFKFREGARAPLVTPPTCGTYETEAQFTGWSDPGAPISSNSSFEVTRGIGGGPCPAGSPGFKPGFSAGSVNPNAGSYSPFDMRLTRQDGEQDMTKFSSILPPGVSAKIAGVAKCSDQAIATAAGKTGLQEKASPSCPASSSIGRTLVGAGVGSVLTYVPGQLYLAGPYKGSPLSVASITPAVAGPFDVGTVVVREALSLDPTTAEVHVDGANSDPIPHILKGIPLKLRDLRVYVDRPNFTVNPTSCDPSAVAATLFGSGLDAFNSGDDQPVALSSRYQAANCASLAFKPRLSLKLKGGVKRSAYPALRAELKARPGDANVGKAVVTLPHSAFLAQEHIGTVCTRVQYAADQCPSRSVYGYARAFTPLLDEPLEGPVYLRSSNHKLPDLVAALHGVVDIDLVGRIDSINGRIRSSFESVPDAPVSRFVLSMQGGKKGLIVNSANLCKGTNNRAKAQFDGQNGKTYDFQPVVKAKCAEQARKGGRSQ